jgi:hypothetical protein
MKSFRQHISEERTLRSPDTALRVLDRLKQKRMVSDKEMQTPVRVVPREQRTHKGWPIDHRTFSEEGKMKDVPVHLIDTTQETVLPDIIKNRIRGSHKQDPDAPDLVDAPYLVRIPETGRYVLHDGNHRFVEAKLMRQPTLRGLVLHADPKPKFDD